MHVVGGELKGAGKVAHDMEMDRYLSTAWLARWRLY
jgi:hypothetical protein